LFDGVRNPGSSAFCHRGICLVSAEILLSAVHPVLLHSLRFSNICLILHKFNSWCHISTTLYSLSGEAYVSYHLGCQGAGVCRI